MAGSMLCSAKDLRTESDFSTCMEAFRRADTANAGHLDAIKFATLICHLLDCSRAMAWQVMENSSWYYDGNVNYVQFLQEVFNIEHAQYGLEVQDKDQLAAIDGAAAAVADMEPVPEYFASFGEKRWKRDGGTKLEAALQVDKEYGESPVRLVDARFIIELQKRGGKFCRRQELPDIAFISLERLKNFMGGGDMNNYLRIVSVSHAWQHPYHPDPKGFNIQILANALASLIGRMPGTYAVFFDFSSLFQKGPNGEERSEQRAVLFKRALANMMDWYSHEKVIVMKLTKLPDGYPEGFAFPSGIVPNKATYFERGWCYCESSVSVLVKNFDAVLDLGKLSGPIQDFQSIPKECRSGRPPPITPAEFRLQLDQKSFTSKKADFEAVFKLYEETITKLFSRRRLLDFQALSWDDDAMVKLCNVFAEFQMTALTTLWVSDNAIGDAGCAELAKVCGKGALANLAELNLAGNAIGDVGCTELAKAVGTGALPKLKTLSLANNTIGDSGCVELAFSQGALPNLTRLHLSGNSIGVAGCNELASAVAQGALPNLTLLHLGRNSFGVDGKGAFGNPRASLIVDWD